jgi:magnesium transporter
MYVSDFLVAGIKIRITWNHVINEDFAPLSRVMVATTFIVFGNIFLVSFGNHQSPGMGCNVETCNFVSSCFLCSRADTKIMLSVYTPEQLIAKYSNLVFVLYCMSLVFVVAFNHYLYR